MLAAVVAAALQHVEEALHVGVDISVRLLQRVPNARLRGEMHDLRKTVLREQGFGCPAIREIELQKAEFWITFQKLQPRLLQFRIVIAVHAVDADDLATLRQQSLRDMKS